jgi:hypothetical protein
VGPRSLSLRTGVMAVFGGVGVVLVPWTIFLATTLPPHHVTRHWDAAWTGFDLGLIVGFLGTAIAAWRRSPWVGVLAGVTGTLLVTDAWFDVILESRVDEQRTAIAFAVLAELPAAAACFWLAYRTERFLGRVVKAVGGIDAALHLTPAGESPTESDLVGVFEVPTDREPAREPRHPDPPA